MDAVSSGQPPGAQGRVNKGGDGLGGGLYVCK